MWKIAQKQLNLFVNSPLSLLLISCMAICVETDDFVTKYLQELKQLVCWQDTVGVLMRGVRCLTEVRARSVTPPQSGS